jgi:hypothetical protein
MGKFSFGFDHTDLPEDQWNLKYLIRQGPKDLRLYLSLFTHNRLGRLLLPELYYLGGVPLTQPMGKRARRLVSRALADSPSLFFLNVFYSTTHPPFASEWPWYTRFADPAYRGESKFAMARSPTPSTSCAARARPGKNSTSTRSSTCTTAAWRNSTTKWARCCAPDACGLADNTIVVVYSDHGMEFFEHDTWGQGNSAVGEASPRIPLVIRDPRKPAAARSTGGALSIDLAPTLLELVAPHPPGMDGVSLAGCLATGCERLPELDAFNETGIWITDIPGLPDKHLRYPDLLELMEVPNRASGTLAIKPEYCETRIMDAKDRMIRGAAGSCPAAPRRRSRLPTCRTIQNKKGA